MWRSDAHWGQMQGPRRARQAALPIPWGNEHWPEDRKGPGEDCRGTAAALGRVVGGESQWRHILILLAER